MQVWVVNVENVAKSRPVRLRPARHTHPHPTPSLRTPRYTDPTHPEV